MHRPPLAPPGSLARVTDRYRQVEHPRPGQVYRHQTIMRIVEPAPEPAPDAMTITWAVVEVRDRRGRLHELDYPVMWFPVHGYRS